MLDKRENLLKQLVALIQSWSVVFAVLMLSACSSEQVPWQTSHMPGYLPKLSFTLTDVNHNKTVTGDDFEGQVVALNFGFTHCPDVCPMALYQMQSALSKMDESAAKQVQVLFATVDPNRDSAEVLKSYTERFGATIGLTGEQAALDQLVSRYKVSVGFGDVAEDGQYDVSHGSQTYVFDRKGKARLLIRPDDTAGAIAGDLARLLSEN